MSDEKIHELARALTDGEWSEYFSYAATDDGIGYDAPAVDCRALLAYLDDVWRGLDELHREFLTDPQGLEDTDDPIACAGALAFEAAKLATFRGPAAHTPLGRAVLQRAKEQGR